MSADPHRGQPASPKAAFSAARTEANFFPHSWHRQAHSFLFIVAILARILARFLGRRADPRIACAAHAHL